MRVLFIGNSFVTANDLPALFVKQAGADVFACSAAFDGARLVDHLARLQDEGGDALLRQALVTWPAAARRWDFVVLQEQSQLLAWPRDFPGTAESFRSAKGLAQAATQVGARVVLFNTWGFRGPEFLSMNHALKAGVEGLADELAKEGPAPLIARVGDAFEQAHADPARFERLYADERHPSLEGSTLAAQVLAKTMGREAGHA